MKGRNMEKAVIPQNVADYIEYCKAWNLSILNAIRKNIDIAYDCAEWVRNNSDEFAKAWVNGYTIQEKYYYVAIPSGFDKYKMLINDYGLLVSSGNYASIDEVKYSTKNRKYNITEKMIKESDLSWAWQFAEELEE